MCIILFIYLVQFSIYEAEGNVIQKFQPFLLFSMGENKNGAFKVRLINYPMDPSTG